MLTVAIHSAAMPWVLQKFQLFRKGASRKAIKKGQNGQKQAFMTGEAVAG